MTLGMLLRSKNILTALRCNLLQVQCPRQQLAYPSLASLECPTRFVPLTCLIAACYWQHLDYMRRSKRRTWQHLHLPVLAPCQHPRHAASRWSSVKSLLDARAGTEACFVHQAFPRCSEDFLQVGACDLGSSVGLTSAAGLCRRC